MRSYRADSLEGRAPGRPFWQALAAFLALPGVVAFLVPWLLRLGRPAVHPGGWIVLGVGVVLLIWCVRDFYVAGRGTLAPWAPPSRLVVIGAYRFTRNPMYVAVLMILAGWAWTFGSGSLWVYFAIVAIAFHLRVVLGEEPWLAETFGEEWADYRSRVPRWLGR